jgi:asparagine synthase (glutamine-hydrolysing)
MFAFAIFNATSGELFAARDRIGIKPLYYAQKNGGLIFASEVKAILHTGLIEKEPDYVALHTPTRFQISPLTGFKNIFKVPPAHYLIFRKGHLTIQPFWKIKPQEKNIDENSAIDQLEELLLKAVKRQMIADVDVGVFLSGGLDSSLLAVLMEKHTSKKIKSFTIIFSKQDQKKEKMSDDSFYSDMIAKKLGFQHHEFVIQPDVLDLLPKMIWHLDEPLADAAAINLFLMSQTARKSEIIVLLNGMGGDEIFGGYRKQLACLKAETYQKIFPSILQNMINSLVNWLPVASHSQGFRRIRWLKRFLSFSSLPPLERFLSSDMSLNPAEYQQFFQNSGTYHSTHFFKSQRDNFSTDGLSYLTQMCINDTKVFLPEHNLTYCDKATMAASVESRPTLTDHQLVEFMFTLPPRYRIRGNNQKYLIKKVAEKYLPREILRRPKGSFASPLRSWIRDPLRNMVDDYLSLASIRKRNLYNPETVQGFITRDRQGKEDNAYLIWQLLTMEIWFRTFF